MKSTRARWIACLLVCAIGVTCGACGKEKEDSGAAENSAGTIASEDLEKMQKQEMTFDFAIEEDDDSSGSADVPVNQGVDNQNGNNSGEDSYVIVTDAAGEPVVDENGNTVTEVVSGGNSGSSNENSNESSTAGNNNSSGNSNSSGNGDTYTPDYKTFQAYWLDMSSGGNVVCNGDFLDVTFKIKEDAPDGNYALTAGANDFANWDAESVNVAFVEGDIAVGSASQKEAGSPESGTFTIAAGTAKGNPGDEVTVRFDMSDNPGIVALIFRFKYDANALEVVDAVVGEDCSDSIEMAISE
ncbi:MAG: cohesin domain-containing protein [Ruminococcus sp.]